MGFVLVPFGFLCLVLSLVVGGSVTTAASFLIAHRADRLSWRVFGAWLPGGVPTGLLWGDFVERLLPPLASDWAIREQDWSKVFMRVALYAAWPGATLLGGGLAQMIAIAFVRKSATSGRR